MTTSPSRVATAKRRIPCGPGAHVMGSVVSPSQSPTTCASPPNSTQDLDQFDVLRGRKRDVALHRALRVLAALHSTKPVASELRHARLKRGHTDCDVVDPPH